MVSRSCSCMIASSSRMVLASSVSARCSTSCSFNENGGKVFSGAQGDLAVGPGLEVADHDLAGGQFVAAQDQGEAGVVPIRNVELFDQLAVVVLGEDRRVDRVAQAF